MRKNQTHEKSIGNETTIRKTSSYEIIRKEYVELCESLSEEMKTKSLLGRTVTLKVKTSDFDLLTRSKSLDRKGFESLQKSEIGNFDRLVPMCIVGRLLQNPRKEHSVTLQR